MPFVKHYFFIAVTFSAPLRCALSFPIQQKSQAYNTQPTLVYTIYSLLTIPIYYIAVFKTIVYHHCIIVIIIDILTYSYIYNIVGKI